MYSFIKIFLKRSLYKIYFKEYNYLNSKHQIKYNNLNILNTYTKLLKYCNDMVVIPVNIIISNEFITE